jgi:hypothetical protein
MRIFISLLIFAFLTSNTYGQKDTCKTCFKKEKKSKKESSFATDKFVQTKFVKIFEGGTRDLYALFKYTDSSATLFIKQQSKDPAFKRPFVLGTAITIRIFFEIDSIYDLKFTSNQNDLKLVSLELDLSSNEKIIDSKLDFLFQNYRILKLEILNPSNINNASKVITEELSAKNSKKLLRYYKCFKLKVKSS